MVGAEGGFRFKKRNVEKVSVNWEWNGKVQQQLALALHSPSQLNQHTIHFTFSIDEPILSDSRPDHYPKNVFLSQHVPCSNSPPSSPFWNGPIRDIFYKPIVPLPSPLPSIYLLWAQPPTFTVKKCQCSTVCPPFWSWGLDFCTWPAHSSQSWTSFYFFLTLMIVLSGILDEPLKGQI